MQGEQQPDYNKTIIALYRNKQALVGLYFGFPSEVADKWADADAFYTIDGGTANFVRLSHYCDTEHSQLTVRHVWEYAESVLPSDVGDPGQIDQVEEVADFVSTIDDESYFKTMAAEIGETNGWGKHSISRGTVFAEAVLPSTAKEDTDA